MIVRSGVAGEMESFAGEFEVAGDRVVHDLGRGVVELHVVGGPPRTERFAAGAQLADQIRECAVVWVAAGVGA